MYDALIEFGLTASHWLQATYPQLVDAMQMVSNFGRIDVYLLIIMLVYWCFDKRYGIQLAYALVFSAFFNRAFKQVLRQPRPFWLDASVGKSDTRGYGFVSEHVQSATVLFFFFASWLREKWLWILATAFILTMAISRVYLGVHFVHDVVGGFLIGCSILVSFALLQHYVGSYFSHRIFGQRLLVMAAIPIILVTIWAGVILFLGEPDVPASWRDLALIAERSHTKGAVQSAAMLLGLGIGFTLERSRVRFQTGGAVWRRGVRFLVGAVGVAAIWEGLATVYDSIIPADTLWLALPLWAIQMALLGLWITYYAPKLFVMLKLAEYSAEPELPYTIRGTSLRKNSKK